jgi:hypothetical protein
MLCECKLSSLFRIPNWTRAIGLVGLSIKNSKIERNSRKQALRNRDEFPLMGHFSETVSIQIQKAPTPPKSQKKNGKEWEV